MKASRPKTAVRDNIVNRKDKHVLIHSTRPQTAASDSLKKIIQVIEQTLTKGAQTILTKINNKTWERYSKSKYHHDSQFRLPQQYSRVDRDIPYFGTQLLIDTHAENPIKTSQPIDNSYKLIKSAKRLYPSHDNDQFVPYLLQGIPKEENLQVVKRQRNWRPLKKSTKHKKNTMPPMQKQNTEPLAPIDKWENDSSLLNLSYLLHTE